MALQLITELGGKRLAWVVAEGTTWIGRREDLPVSLPVNSVSRVHATLRKQGDEMTIQDLGSRNGTFLNGLRVQEPRPVRPGDRIAIGSVPLFVVDSESLPEQLDATLAATPTSLDPDSNPSDRGSRLYRVMMDLGEFLAAEHTQQEVDHESLVLVERLMPYGRAWMLRLDRSGHPLVAAVRNIQSDSDELPEAFWAGVHDALRQRRPVLLEDAVVHFPLGPQPGTGRAAVVPLSTDDEVLGALYLEAHRAVGGYSTKDVRRLGWLANLLAIKAANARLSVVRDELRTAGRMQCALLGNEPKCPRGYEVRARLVPVSTIGGDLYDTLGLSRGRCLYAIGDAVGEGVGAALLMASVLAALRALALTAKDPLDLMTHLQQQFHRSMGETGFVTLFLGVLDPAEHRLDFVNAGHPPPAVIDRDGHVERLDTEGMPLGMDFHMPYARGSVELRPGSLLCAWSDGLTEAYNEKRAADFEEGRLLQVIHRARREPLEAILDQVFGAVGRWLEGYAAQDDRTLLLVRRKAEDNS